MYIRLGHHSFHRGADIKIGKLSSDVPVEERAEIGIRVRGRRGTFSSGCVFDFDMVSPWTPMPTLFMSDSSNLTTHSVNRMSEIKLCLYVWLWTESFWIFRHQRPKTTRNARAASERGPGLNVLSATEGRLPVLSCPGHHAERKCTDKPQAYST